MFTASSRMQNRPIQLYRMHSSLLHYRQFTLQLISYPYTFAA